MADFAPNYTARYRFNYTSLGKSHSMTWRLASGVTDPASLATKIGLMLDDLTTFIWDDFAITAASFAPADSDIFLPAVMPTFGGGSVAVATSVLSDSAGHISFVGRSALGGKARMFLYGTTIPSGVRTATIWDFKVLSSEIAAISDAIVRLNETGPAIVANDDSIVSWYEYVNFKYNDRWVRRLRRG
jgi:hypothetical protein